MSDSRRRSKARSRPYLGDAASVSAAGYDSRADDTEPKVKVGDASFKCITEMAKVRQFYVDNLLGNLVETVAVANRGPATIQRARWCS